MKAGTILATTPLPFVLIAFLAICPTSVSALVITDDASGGGCSSVGDWNVSTKTCTLTQDISATTHTQGSEQVIISSNNITLDGAGHIISTTAEPNNDAGTGIRLSGVIGITLRNITVSGFWWNIDVLSADTVIESVRIENAGLYGVALDASDNITFTHNPVGVVAVRGSSLAFTRNNFLDNEFDISIDESSVSLFRPLK